MKMLLTPPQRRVEILSASIRVCTVRAPRAERRRGWPADAGAAFFGGDVAEEVDDAGRHNDEECEECDRDMKPSPCIGEADVAGVRVCYMVGAGRAPGVYRRSHDGISTVHYSQK